MRVQRVIAVSSLYHYYIRRAGERGPAQYSGGACTIVFFGFVRVELPIASRVACALFVLLVLAAQFCSAFAHWRGSACVEECWNPRGVAVWCARLGRSGVGSLGAFFRVEMRSQKRDRFSVPFLGPFSRWVIKARPTNGPEHGTAYFSHRAASDGAAFASALPQLRAFGAVRPPAELACAQGSGGVPWLVARATMRRCGWHCACALSVP